MSESTQIKNRIDSFRDAMIDLQIKLCSLPAIAPENGGEGEAKKAQLLLEFLKESGYDRIDVIKAPDLEAPSGYRPNIIARYKGHSSEKTVWVMTHMDVVPPGELALWKGDPFQAWVERGKIFGRGVEDNQQEMVASLFALKAFHTEGIRPRYDVGIVLVADEETGNEKGIDYVLKRTDVFRPQDLIIVPDAGNVDGSMIEVAEKSLLWLKVKTLGIQTHGSTPERGVNSFTAAAHLIVELGRLYQLFNAVDDIFDPPISTFEPTCKEANVPNINTIPGDDVFYMDCRILPQYNTQEVISHVQEMCREIERRRKVRIELEIIQNAPAAPPTSADAPVVRALQQAIKATLGIEGEPTGIGGNTVASFFRHAGFQAASWSKVDETAHQPNEYCIIDNMLDGAKVFAHIFLQDE
jgi:succinyl-diaminopimelate desuccinylase